MAVTLLAGLMVSILLIRSLASGVTVSHSGEGNCSRNDITETIYNFLATANVCIKYPPAARGLSIKTKYIFSAAQSQPVLEDSLGQTASNLDE